MLIIILSTFNALLMYTVSPNNMVVNFIGALAFNYIFTRQQGNIVKIT